MHARCSGLLKAYLTGRLLIQLVFNKRKEKRDRLRLSLREKPCSLHSKQLGLSWSCDKVMPWIQIHSVVGRNLSNSFYHMRNNLISPWDYYESCSAPSSVSAMCYPGNASCHLSFQQGLRKLSSDSFCHSDFASQVLLPLTFF